jgi:predicted nucleic-acid-binding protein
VERHCSHEQPGRIDRIVLCEAVWALSTSYGYERTHIANFIDPLLRTPSRRVDAHDEVAAALRRYRESAADFADCLIGLMNRGAGCEITATFDRRASKLDEFELISI